MENLTARQLANRKYRETHRAVVNAAKARYREKHADRLKVQRAESYAPRQREEKVAPSEDVPGAPRPEYVAAWARALARCEARGEPFPEELEYHLKRAGLR